MPPRPFALKVVTDEPLESNGAAPKSVLDDLEAWEVKPDGTCAMLGKSLRGQYVFGQEGLIKAAGQDAPHYKVREQDILFIKPLGAGACATVHKGYHRELRKFVAVKRVSVQNKEMRQQVLRDIKILADALEVPGLLSFLGAYFEPAKQQMAIVLEYMDGGTLAEVLKKLGRLPEDVLAVITAKLLKGLAFMHAKHMVHRDIKPANILMSLAGEAKLSDFGISATVDHTLAQCTTYAGTLTYMSPERLESKPYNFTADIWSLGLVLVECLTGKYPYDTGKGSFGPVEIALHVMQDDPPVPPAGAVSDLCRDFLAACLQREPSKRPPASVLLSHPWVSQAAPVNLKGLLRQHMLSVDDRLEQIAYQFSFTYYSMLSQGPQSDGWQQLAPLYLDHSVLTYQGDARQGRQAIMSRLAEASHVLGGCVAWRVASVDCQPMLWEPNGHVVVHVGGSVQLGSNTGPAAGTSSLAFTECFLLARTPAGEYYIANQVFRLMP